MIIKILFWDTDALLKMFVKEDGTDNVRWLTSAETKALYGLQFFVNDQVCFEFKKNINKFAENGKISKKKSYQIMNSFFNDYKNRYFKVLGQKSLLYPNKEETSIDTIIEELNLKVGTNDWDGLHYKSIIDALAGFDAESHPILVTCDKSFAQKVEGKGYRIINPINQSLNEIQAVLTDPYV